MAYIWREAFSNIKYGGVISVLSIIIVTLTMIVFGIFLIIFNYLNSELSILKKSPFVVAFLENDLKDSAIKSIKNNIESQPQVSSVKYISKQDALRRTEEIFKNRKEILEGLDTMNPLPSSFEIEIKPEFLGSVKNVANNIKKLPGVEDVQHEEEASIFVKNIETVIIIIGITMTLASIIIICFSVMITTYIRHDEIKIMRLIGSTNSFIRIPLLLQGIIQGLMGSVLGLVIIYIMFNVYGMFNLMVMNIDLRSFLPFNQLAGIIIAGAFIGFLGGVIPLRKLSRI